MNRREIQVGPPPELFFPKMLARNPVFFWTGCNSTPLVSESIIKVPCSLSAMAADQNAEAPTTLPFVAQTVQSVIIKEIFFLIVKKLTGRGQMEAKGLVPELLCAHADILPSGSKTQAVTSSARRGVFRVGLQYAGWYELKISAKTRKQTTCCDSTAIPYGFK